MNSQTITAFYFKRKTGRAPENDDLERCNCKEYGTGHWGCGWCKECDLPVFQCGHWLNRAQENDG